MHSALSRSVLGRWETIDQTGIGATQLSNHLKVLEHGRMIPGGLGILQERLKIVSVHGPRQGDAGQGDLLEMVRIPVNVHDV